MNESEAGDDSECRVCRSGAEPNHPLYSPCSCTGSIGLVHQDCLEAWLKHAQKTKCELCGVVYDFAPQYAPDTPAQLPLWVIIETTARMLVVNVVPSLLKILAAIFIWLIMVPLLTAQIYRIWIRNRDEGNEDSFGLYFFSGLLEKSKSDIIGGIVLCALILFSCIVALSFADFVRFLLAPEDDRRQQQENNVNANEPPAPAGPEAAVAGGGAPAAPVAAGVAAFNMNEADRIVGVNHVRPAHVGQTFPDLDPVDQNSSAVVPKAENNSPRSPKAASPSPQSRYTHGTQSDLSASDNTSIHYKSRRSRFSPNRLNYSSIHRPKSWEGRESSSSNAGVVSRRIIPSNDASASPIVRQGFVSNKQSSINGRSFHQAASTSRAYDIEGSVGKLKAWNDTSVNVNDIEVDPLDSLLEASIHSRIKNAIEDCNNTENSTSFSIGTGTSEGGNNSDDDFAEYYSEDEFAGDDASDDEASAVGEYGEPSHVAADGLAACDDAAAQAAQPDVIDNAQNIPIIPAPEANLPVANENAQPDAAVVGEDGGEDVEDVLGLDPEDRPDADMPPAEVHIALDRLLGLRAFGNLLRNSLWLLAFNFVFIAVFVALPYLIGLATLNSLENTALSARLYAGSRSVFPIFCLVAEEALRKSASSGDAFQVLDLVLLGFGYSVAFFLIFTTNEVIKASARYFVALRGPFANTLSNFSNVIKVGLLLYMRVFFLPIVLGGMIMRFLDVFMDYPVKMWIEFFSSNIAGAGALAWVLGITYMVTTTLTVLQLREVLHPRYLASFVRPQEPHLDLLNSLMVEPMWVHIRRICASMLIYVSFSILYVLLPLIILRATLNHLSTPDFGQSTHSNIVYDTILGMLDAFKHVLADVLITANDVVSDHRNPKFELRFCYYIPQIQIPFEVTIAHFTILTIVEKKKNIIGKCMHAWLVYMCRLLGITRLLLPHAYLRSVDAAATVHNASDNATDGILAATGWTWPLPGWDSKTTRNLTRWAWVNEPLSDLEKNVAPIAVPSWWGLRLALLIVAVWVTLSVFSLTVIFGPMLVGRTIMVFLQMPFSPTKIRIHDPLAFGIGCATFGACINLITNASMKKISRYARSISNIPSSLIITGLKVIGGWAASCFLAGLTLHLAFNSDSSLNELMLPSTHFLMFVKGLVLLTFIAKIASTGYIEATVQYFVLSIDDFYLFPNMSYNVSGHLRAAVNDNKEFLRAQNPEREPDHQHGAGDLVDDNGQNLTQNAELIAFFRSQREYLARPMTALSTGKWEEEEVRLQGVLLCLIKPLLGQTLPPLHLLPVLGAQVFYLEHAKLDASVRQQQMIKLLFFYSILKIVSWAFPNCLAVVRSCYRSIYGLVRDAKYLVGRQLRNRNTPGQAHMNATSTI